jgi:hypothetical protein
MNDQSRKEFEAWATENGMGLHLDRSESGLYVSPVTQKFLGCWVASQAKQAAEVEALRKAAGRYQWTSTEGNWVARFHGKWRAHTGEYGDANPTGWYPSREEAIDAAMSKEAGQ